jgi:hypothetical protein
MLGSESPLSRYSWSRRTREAPGHHREVGSEGSVARRGGARDTNPIGGVGQSGRAGTPPHSPPSTSGRCCIHPASLHRRYDRVPREICGVSCEGLRTAQGSLTAPQQSADGIVPPATVGRPERWKRVVAWGGAASRHSARGRAKLGLWDALAAGTPGDDAPVGVMAHPDCIHRTAVFVTRTSGGVGGGRPRGPSLSR